MKKGIFYYNNGIKYDDTIKNIKKNWLILNVFKYKMFLNNEF